MTGPERLALIFLTAVVFGVFAAYAYGIVHMLAVAP